MSRSSILLLFALLFCGSIRSQELLLERQFDSVYNSAISLADKIERIDLLIAANACASDSVLGGMHHALGLLHFKSKDFKAAVNATQKAIVYRTGSGQDPQLKHNSQYNLSFYFNALGETEARISVLNDLVKDPNPDRFTYKSLIELGYYYSDLGDYFKSLQSFELVVNAYEIHNDQRTLALGYMGLIYVMSLMEAPELRQLPYASYISKIQELSAATTAGQLAACNTNIGRLYEQLDEPEISVAYYTKALAYYREQNAQEQTAILLNNLGSVKGKTGNLHEAITFYHKALEQSGNSQIQAVVYDNLGYYTANPVQAEAYFEKAIYRSLGMDLTADFKLPTREELEHVRQKSDLLRILIDYAQFLFKGRETTSFDLNIAKQLVLLSDYLITLIRSESQLERSKLFWIGRGVNVYLLGVEISYELKDAATAFYFMERNKAMLLLEQLQNQDLSGGSVLPKAVDERHRLLKRQLRKSSQKMHTDTAASFKRKYLIDFANYNSFIDSLRVAFPNYMDGGRFLEIKSWNQVLSDYINTDTALVTYILGDDRGFGIYADQGGTEFFALTTPPQIQNLTRSLIAQCRRPFTTVEDYLQYARQANKLFVELFPFSASADRLANKRLIVLPDAELQQFSFETLVTRSEVSKPLSLPYLIRTTRVSYLHSFSVDGQLKELKTSEQKAILTVAPGNFKNDSLVSLRRSESEAEFLSSLFKTTPLIGEQASKMALRQQLGKYSVIHFSTHAGYLKQRGESWLALSDSIITTNELYTSPTSAELVTLGACQSAEGLFAWGEGTLSLSRAFFVSGTQSVLASLWNANEKANTQILFDFYSNLSKGKTKDMALQQAKLDYLENAQLSEASPYHWANLTITGRCSTLRIESADRPWMGVLLGALTLMTLLLFFKFRSRGKTL